MKNKEKGMTQEEHLIDLLKSHILALEEDIKSWNQSIDRDIKRGMHDSDFGSYIEGAIDQARDEIKYLSNLIEQYEK